VAARVHHAHRRRGAGGVAALAISSARPSYRTACGGSQCRAGSLRCIRPIRCFIRLRARLRAEASGEGGRRGIRAVAVHKMSAAAPHWRRIP
jgi:hypothetical protein